jgi:general nucleoside transport system permease protein
VSYRLVRRENTPRWALPLACLVAVVFTMVLSGFLVWLVNAPIGATFELIFRGSIGSQFALTETLTRATPLILTGLAVAVAFRAKLYNIGAEGQLYMGAVAAVAVGGLHGGSGWDVPSWLLFPALWVAASLAGAILLLLPTWLKTEFKVDEVVTTLLLNFIALLFVSMLLDGPMKDPSGMGWPQSVGINPDFELTRLLDPTRLHSGLLIALVLALLIAFLNRYTTLGLMMRNTGHNAHAAEFMGLPVKRVTLTTALLSGALAGLAGAIEVTGRAGYLTLDMSPGYGYTGVVVAMLAALNPVGVIFSSVFIAGIFVGADSMSRSIAVPSYLADVMVAIALLNMLVATLLTQFRLQREVHRGAT